MGIGQLTGGPRVVLVYALISVLVPLGVVAGDRRARQGSLRGDVAAQLGLGIVAGMWALPATSGLVAILAVVAGVRSAFRSDRRWYAVLAFAIGVLIGVGVLGLSFVRSGPA
jgi:hypothetical protein